MTPSQFLACVAFAALWGWCWFGLAATLAYGMFRLEAAL